MKYVFWIVALFISAVAINSIAHNAAYVLLFYPPYRIDLSMSLFLAMLLILIVAIYNLSRLVKMAINLPKNARNFRAQRAREKRRSTLDAALNAFVEARYDVVEHAAQHALQQGDQAGVYAILAASAAHQQHDYAKRDAYLAWLHTP